MELRRLDTIAFYNFLESKYERTLATPNPRSRPYFLTLDPTSVCQLRCPFCPTGIENEDRRRGLSTRFRHRTPLSQEVYDIILKELGDVLFYVLFFNWGEPLLSAELPALVRRAAALGIYTEIHTNLSLPLSEGRCKELLSSGLDEIGASIDGFSQATYSTYRRGGDYELARTNLERLVELRDQMRLDTKIVWNFLVFRFNEHEIEEARAHCQERGIEFRAREASIDRATHPDWVPSRPASDWASPVPPGSGEAVLGTGRVGSRPSAPGTCAWHYSFSAVGADGRVSPCCGVWSEDHDFGVIEPQGSGFREVWSNRRFQRARSAVAGGAPSDSGAATICESCPFGAGVQDLYTPLEGAILRGFDETFGGQDTLLARGFAAFRESGDALLAFFAEHHWALQAEVGEPSSSSGDSQRPPRQ